MAKWFSLIAFVIAAAAAYLLFESQGNVETMQKKGETLKSDLVTTQGTLKTTKETLETTKKNLADKTAEQEKTAADLATATTKLTEATTSLESIMTQLKEAKLLEEGGDLKTNIAKLTGTIKQLTDDKANAEAKIAAANADKDAAVAKAGEAEKKVAELNLMVTNLTGDKTAAEAKITDQGKVIDKYKNNIMQKGIRGRVLAVNSGWGFAVVSIGDKQGAAANKTLVVARGGQSIGKLKISNVESNQSIADIVPNTFIRGTYVQPGDDVIYTGDEKVKIDDAPAGAGAVIPPLPTHAGPQ